jgi:hypothetical protein
MDYLGRLVEKSFKWLIDVLKDVSSLENIDFDNIGSN